MRKIRLFAICIISMVALTLTACDKKEEIVEEAVEVVETEEVNMFGLTGEEQKMYAEYAAGVLMKYNAGTNNRVLEGQKLIQQEAKEDAAREQALRREQLAAEYEKGKNTNKKENTSSDSPNSSSTGVSSGVSYISDMASVAGMNDFSIRYMGCEITDSYPKAGDDLFMAMDATAGKVLLVAEFEVTNNSAETKNFDMFSNQGKFKLKINGKNYKSQYTLLLNDLSMYKGQLEANESVATVLIFEIPQTEAVNQGDMTLAITIDGNTEYMSLSGNVSSDVDVDVDVLEENVAEDEDTVAVENDENEAEDDVTESVEEEEEVSDLAEEYMEALEAMESDTIYEGTVNGSSGNVTVVGSKGN